MNDNTFDQRRHPRHDIPLQASLQAAGVVVPCRVHNISASGALIEASAYLRIGERAAVKIPDFGTIVGHVARISSTTVGIAFEDGEAAIDVFIGQWLALESRSARRSETKSADALDCQAI